MANIRHLVIAAVFLAGFAIIQAISRSEMEAFKSQQVTVDVINQLPDQLLQVGLNTRSFSWYRINADSI